LGNTRLIDNLVVEATEVDRLEDMRL
jgi:hypothetical protein